MEAVRGWVWIFSGIAQYTQIYCLYSTSRLVVIHMYKGKG